MEFWSFCKSLLGYNDNVDEVIREGQSKLKSQISKLNIEEGIKKQQINHVKLRIIRAAQTGDKNQAKIIAREYSVLKRAEKSLRESKLRIQTLIGILTNLKTARNSEEALKATLQAMRAVNLTIRPNQVQKTVMEFGQESVKIQRLEAMIDESVTSILNDPLDAEAEEEEEEGLINSIFEELGLSFDAKLDDSVNSSQSKQEKDERDALHFSNSFPSRKKKEE